MGAALAMVPVGILAAVIPGGLIHLCMMETMRCHAVMKPGARCFGIIIAVLAVLSAVMSARKAKNNKA
jgi:predicted cation transporter